MHVHVLISIHANMFGLPASLWTGGMDVLGCKSMPYQDKHLLMHSLPPGLRALVISRHVRALTFVSCMTQ